jgi:perosamine synthetase
MPISYEPGAPTSKDVIPLCVPEIRGNEWKYIKECLDTNFVSSVGPYVDRFEKELAEYIGIPYAVATTSGTAALHIALITAGIEAGDEIIIPSLTFISPVNVIDYVGALPVFMDSEPEYWQLDPEKLRAFLQEECDFNGQQLTNRASGRRIKAIICVHILGHPNHMEPILALAKAYGLIVIEDATECLGAKYKGQYLGTFGDIACFSFNGNKIITTGGGGMIVTAKKEWAARARYLSTQAKDDPLEFIHNEVGYNYRLSNVSAAMGVAQLELLDSYIQKKREIAERYTKAFADIPGLTVMKQAEWAQSIFWLFTMLVDEEKFGISSRELLRELGKAGIQTRPLWQPIHLSPAHNQNIAYQCDVAEALNRNGISLPCSVGLDVADQDRVIAAILSFRRK